MITKLSLGKQPSKQEIIDLTDPEKAFFNKIVQRSRVDAPIPKEAKVVRVKHFIEEWNKEQMNRRLSILIAEILAGNDSKLIKGELRGLANTMISNNLLTVDQANIIEQALRGSRRK